MKIHHFIIVSLSVILGCPLFSHARACSGFGADAVGGKKKCIVSSLADNGAGTLRACLGKEGQKVLFKVGGEIALESVLDIPAHTRIQAGRKNGGITITGHALRLQAPDIVLENIRHRGGVPTNVDALLITGIDAHDICLKNLSLSNDGEGADGNIDIVEGAHDITLQDSLLIKRQIAPVPVKNSLHRDGTYRVSFLRNILAANTRNPQVQNAAVETPSLELINNIIQFGTGHGVAVVNEATANVERNIFVSLQGDDEDGLIVNTGGRVYAAGNVSNEQDIDVVGTEICPFPRSRFHARPAMRLVKMLLRRAGTRPRDVIDEDFLDAFSWNPKTD